MQLRKRVVLAFVALVLALAIAANHASAEERTDGFHVLPSLGWTHGDNQIDLFVVSRYRWENWNAVAPTHSNMQGLRTRFGVSYAWRDRIELKVEGQHTAVFDLGAQSSGIAANYWVNSGMDPDPSSVNVRQLYLKVRPTDSTMLEVGRQAIRMGRYVEYTEPDWKYLKQSRMGERLVGIVDWSNGSRAYDGILGTFELRGQHVTAFAARPTRGVFDINGAFEPLDDVYAGGFEWTAKRGTLSERLDFTGFFIGFGDQRTNTSIDNDVAIYTLGGSATGIFEIGPGRLDAFVWGAFQAGHFREGAGLRNLDQIAGALLAEVGYQLPGLLGKPWFRTGVNYGSGDGNPNDGDHNTFYNVLPTNHGYYGLVDQLAMQNLVDWFAQIRWSPLDALRLEFFVHHFWLATSRDMRYVGTGAFSPTAAAYGGSPSNGSNDVGWETDIVLSHQLHRTTTLMAGYGQLFGGDVFAGAANGRDVQWGFAQLQFAY